MMCESIIKTYEIVAPKTEIRTSRAPPLMPLSESRKPMTPGTTSATHGTWRRLVTESHLGRYPARGERVDLARVGVDERVEARDQTSEADDVDEGEQDVLTAVSFG